MGGLAGERARVGTRGTVGGRDGGGAEVRGSAAGGVRGLRGLESSWEGLRVCSRLSYRPHFGIGRLWLGLEAEMFSVSLFTLS